MKCRFAELNVSNKKQCLLSVIFNIFPDESQCLLLHTAYLPKFNLNFQNAVNDKN